MGYIRLDEQPGEVYHYTHRKNLDSILRDGRIRRMGDRERLFGGYPDAHAGHGHDGGKALL